MSSTASPIPRRAGSVVKTAISLEPALLERIDAAAERLELARSQFLARAADDYLRRLESRQMLTDLNAVYGDGPDAEEAQVLAAHRERRRRRGVAG